VTRVARKNSAGALTHIVSLFAPRGARFRGEEDRANYLSRVDACIQNSDWQLLAYALMPDRIHWLAIAGQAPLSGFIKPLHVGFALWLNYRYAHDGPVFAERPRTLESEPSEALDLIAYIHNSPVRNGDVARAADSPWTSHRAYLGLQPAPRWLRTDRCLALCDLAATSEGLRRLGECVDARRRQSALLVRPSGAVRDALLERAISAPRRWDGPASDILRQVGRITGIAPERMCSTERSREVVRARRVAVLTGVRHLGRTLTEMAQLVGITASSASRLVRTNPSNLARACAEAERVAEMLIEAAASARAAQNPTAAPPPGWVRGRPRGDASVEGS
jgi:putative transposase